ncbi:transporter, UIT6 family [Paludibacter propionicigenes WB4]|uniref:Transporter, UIT6 family n=1 Tax=Paludibacter propionicigenes (strain DSM 17365 / JCM 13257 / WB4) TaxID=694427 RepID=E4T3F5_PALPW|nr:sodium:proton antiporter [Paludibacter propionicigenes]ADQ79249.1 transporter, UIT6 family [Paludibacter propionicigenes WB4]
MKDVFSIPLWCSIPFVVMLLAIAIGPLIAENWWGKNKNKLLVSLFLGIPVTIYMLANGLSENLLDTVIYDYVPFMILLGSLFIITGGIHISGDIKATPLNNTLFLGIGYVLASIMGTTGAAMLLIRPVIATNSERRFTTHTILFFIAAVANCGGLLTPLGDPPLFMIYLRGAEFSWFLNLFPEWLFTGTLLLLIYYFVDRYYYKKEDWTNIAEDYIQIKPIRVTGNINFLFLVGVVIAVALINKGTIHQMGEENASIGLKYLREIVLLLLAGASLYFTKSEVRKSNKFSWEPIVEVAYLFLGIFITMAPTLLWLAKNAASFGVTEPWQFMYASGALSSFLDNTPTAVAFYDLARGLVTSGLPASLSASVMTAGIPEILLKAICVGAVFFGSMTYIGNGPNFMVKSIAEESGIKMPSFFSYMFRFSLIVLLPIYILVQLIFI